MVRHAGPAEAEVTVRYEHRQVTVQVDDAGRGTWAHDGAPSGMASSGCVSESRCGAAPCTPDRDPRVDIA